MNCRTAVVTIIVVLMLVGTACSSPPRVNPSFDVSTRDAKAAMGTMAQQPKRLARPLVILGGFSDPGWVSSKVRSKMSKLFDRADRDRILVVNFAATSNFEQCRRRVVRAVDEAFPTHDPGQTVEVDVIGISMGGLVARVAAEMSAPDERRLRIARLFTISSPLRGARLAERHPIVLTSMHRDMRAGSALLRELTGRKPGYEVVSYTRLGDDVVGEAYASPDGHAVWWLDGAPFEHAHWAALDDPRILADIARRLRGEAPFTTGPPAPLPVTRETRKRMARCGRDTIDMIERDFRGVREQPALYVEQLDGTQHAAFCWPAGVQLTALAAAARVDPSYVHGLRAFADALRRYRTEAHGIAGLDVLRGPKPSDRYYDDNAWVVLGLLETYDVTRDRRHLHQAVELFDFVLSGEDDTLGGGIWWRENERKSKNACSNAPAIVGALRLHDATGERRYFETAQRLYAWTNAHLQDADALYFDHVRRNGTVEKTKWSYNSALMIRANVRLWRATSEERYREEASRIAKAATGRWVREADGAVSDESPFAHLLIDAFCELAEAQPSGSWDAIAARAATFLHDHGHDARGYYGKRFDAPPAPDHTPRLIDQASAARAFFRIAGASHKEP